MIYQTDIFKGGALNAANLIVNVQAANCIQLTITFGTLTDGVIRNMSESLKLKRFANGANNTDSYK
jgi:hypothetical protein